MYKTNKYIVNIELVIITLIKFKHYRDAQTDNYVRWSIALKQLFHFNNSFCRLLIDGCAEAAAFGSAAGSGSCL